MTRIHDMGGRFGDGAVELEPQGIPRFKAEWHPRALAITVAAGALGKWNIDMSRRAREGLSPNDYARFSYYEKWIAALADLLVETKLVSAGELEAALGDDGALQEIPQNAARITAEKMVAVLERGGPTARDNAIAPRFRINDAVRTVRPAANRLVDGGHTRLPAYAAGARGRILRSHGAHVLPDSNAHGLGEAAEPLYSVVFPGSELWAAPEHPGDEVVLDLWQSYLEPA